MCERCLINPLCFGEVLPGFYLSKARRQSIHTKVGQWVLIETNDPVFTFDFNFHIEVGSDQWDDQVFSLWDQLTAQPHDGYRLVLACVEKGYDPKTSFVDWFALAFREWLVVTEPELFNTEDDLDPFPKLDQLQPTDYSPWIKPLPLEQK